ncbi:G-protein coupled receptor GRL101-like isoform X2 [Biomphalaria glabrata]|nr:G-protein coupled receptor GRL101-like isoform X2 [Biomphalaria glabrata]
MFISYNGISDIHLEDYRNAVSNCSEVYHIDKIFHASKVWFSSRNRSLPAFFLVSVLQESLEKRATFIHNILKEQSKDTRVNRFFIIHTAMEKTLPSSDSIYYHNSYLELKIENVFPKVCEIRCEDNMANFSSDYTTSYYHIADVLNMSYDQSVQYCAGKVNSYLVSLESSQEIIFVLQLIKKRFDYQKINHFRLSVGIKDGYYYFLWFSGNPFVSVNRLFELSSKKCFFLNISISEIDLSLAEVDYRFLYNELYSDCTDVQLPTLVLCECHEVHRNEHFTRKLLYAVSSDVNKISTRHYFLLLQAVLSEKYHKVKYKRSDKFQTILCQNLGNKSDYLQMYVCRSQYQKQEISSISYVREIDERYYVLESINISDCENYRECQQNIRNRIAYTVTERPLYIPIHDIQLLCIYNNNTNYSNDTNMLNVIDNSDFSCESKILKLNSTSPSSFQCEFQQNISDYRCIRNRYYVYCKDNSHLQNCENFTCPKDFIKCPKSYCISNTYIGDRVKDCPYGEDELKLENYSCAADFTLKSRGVCIDVFNWVNNNWILPFSENITFECNPPCPKDFVCVSTALHIEDGVTGKKYIKYTRKRTFNMFSLFNLMFQTRMYLVNFPLLQVVEFYGPNCRIQNFDYGFQYWKLLDLIVLDLSYNEMTSSNEMKSISNLSQLKVLNISHNTNLTVGKDFFFPRSLEIIDLSYTKTSSLKLNVFENVSQLKVLKLSNTFISRFQDMGIPEYFTLETLYIENVTITNIEKKFFRGLTIKSELRASDYKLCCPQILNPNISVDKCHAPLDAISSCKHLVGDILKRITIWIVGVVTLVGNGIVLVYRIGWNREIFKKAYGLFISGLAVSDFIMGVYLILIATVDIQYKNIYVLEDVKWRHSVLCQFAGFLSTISSETSKFFICLITIDRFLKITYPFGQHKFSKTGKIFSFTLVWFFGFMLALIPIIATKWNIYSSNGLCLALPLGSTENNGWVFSFIVFVVFNFILFLFIAFGQICILSNHKSIRRSIRNLSKNIKKRKEDMSIARKLAFVALTDFMCWFPVGILGFLSLKGHIFDREVYAWIAVFVMPINSALNPIIYTIPSIYQKYSSKKAG